MAALILLALFLCGLLNSLFFPSSKLLPRLRCLLLSAIPKPPIPDPNKNHEEHRSQTLPDPSNLKTLFSFGSEAEAGEEKDCEIRDPFEVFDGNGDGKTIADSSNLKTLFSIFDAISKPASSDLNKNHEENRSQTLPDSSNLKTLFSFGSGEEKDCEIREAFEMFDVNGDGKTIADSSNLKTLFSIFDAISKPPSSDLNKKHEENRSQTLPDPSNLKTLFSTFGSEAEKDCEIREPFEVFGGNGDGKRIADSFNLKTLFSFGSEADAGEEKDCEIREAFEVFDGNVDGKTIADSSNLKTLFSTFDADGDGFISTAELGESLRRLDLPATGDDANGDGLIDINEFNELYASFGSKAEKDCEIREAFEVFDGNVDGKTLANSSNLKTLFSTFDADGDGFISTAELGESLRRLGLHATGDDLTSMMRRIDANGDGLIDINEFGELCASFGSEAEADEEKDRELREAFEVFDGNGDGVITVEELSLVLRSLGLRQGDRVEVCRDMINRVDLDGDGMVNFEEFKKMMVGNCGGNFF